MTGYPSECRREAGDERVELITAGDYRTICADGSIGEACYDKIVAGYPQVGHLCFRLKNATDPVVVSMVDSSTGATVIEPVEFDIEESREERIERWKDAQ